MKSTEKGRIGEANALIGLLTNMVCEVSIGSKSLDNTKMDMVLNILSPFDQKVFHNFTVQVKAGGSYGEVLSEPGYSFKPYKGMISKNTGLPVRHLLLWLPDETNSEEIYWIYMHPGLNNAHKINFNKIQRLTEFSVIDILRFHEFQFKYFGPKYPKIEHGRDWLDLCSVSNNKSFATKIKETKKYYHNLKGISNPLFGNINLTRKGFNKSIKKNRLRKDRVLALNLIMNLEKLLSRKPQEFFPNVQSINFRDYPLIKKRFVEYVLIYYIILIDDSNQSTGYSVGVKIEENLGIKKNKDGESIISYDRTEGSLSKECKLNCIYIRRKEKRDAKSTVTTIEDSPV